MLLDPEARRAPRRVGRERSRRSDDLVLHVDFGDTRGIAQFVPGLRFAVRNADGTLSTATLRVGIIGFAPPTILAWDKRWLEGKVYTEGVREAAARYVPEMRAQGAGRLLFVGSLSGRAPIPFQAHYSATKAAIEALAFSLANEVQPFGLTVSLIEPGDIDTAFNDVMDWGEPPPTSAYRDRQKRCETTIRESLPKAPKPGIVADAVAHALTSKHPRLRYAVGNEARLVGLGKRLLSDRLNLKLIRDHFGI